MVFPLIFLKSWTVYSVPPVCTVSWTPADWDKLKRTVCEPLIVYLLDTPWAATGERDEHGRMLYRSCWCWKHGRSHNK